MSAQHILKTVETMSYRERIIYMITLGRDIEAHRSDIAALRTGGVYERRLALFSCSTSHDADHVMEALNDESRLIRSQALKLLALVGRDAQVMSVLEALPIRRKPILMRALIKQKPSRRALVDVYLRQCLERHQEDEARLVLSFGSTPVVSQYMQQLIQPGHLIEWTRLARQHPVLTLAALQKHAETARSSDHWLISVAVATIPLFIKKRVEGIVSFVEVLLRQFHPRLLNRVLQDLANAYPVEMAALALATSEPLGIHFAARVDDLNDMALISALIERNYLSVSAVWLKKLPPEQRSSLYQRFGLGWRDEDGVLTEDVVAQLTASEREAEARRHLALPILKTRTQQRMPYAAFLPWADVQTTIDPILRNPDAQLRILAFQVLINALRYHRSQASALLATLKARKNEQDPIRMTIFNGLVKLPPSLWTADLLDDLGQIIQDALNASDQSFATGTAAERLVIKLLPFHPAWGAEWLAILIQKRGQISHYRLQNSITETDMQRVGPALLPVLLSWESREREGPLLTLLQSLGRRITLMPELADLLERLVTQGTPPQPETAAAKAKPQSAKHNTASRWSVWALQILRKHFKDRTALLIPRLIQDDPSWGTQPIVYEFLHRERQDLITPFLGHTAYKGRFSTGKTRFVLPLYGGFERWTMTQQGLFAQTLSQLGSDSERDTPTVIRAIQQLGGLMYIPPTHLLALAEDKRLPVRDTALRTLGQLDGPKGIQALLAAMGDDRARIAIYALRHALLQMSPDAVLALLEQVPLNKITVAKEVVRLIGELDIEAAFQKLLSFAQQDLHRDVRVALLRALWTHLEREDTWPILIAAATSADPALAIMAGRTMAPSRSPEVERKLIQLLVLVLKHPDPEVRINVLRRLSTQDVHDADRVLAAPLVESLKSPLYDEVVEAASAFGSYIQQDPILAGEIVKQLLPVRRTLQEIIRALSQTFWTGNDEVLAAGRAILDALSTNPMTVALRLDVGAMIFSMPEFAALIQQIADAGELHAEALMHAVDHLSNHRMLGTPESDLVEEAWRNHVNPALRRLGLAILIESAISHSGWTNERRAILKHYQQDRDPLVASVAQFIFPPDEAEEDLSV